MWRQALTIYSDGPAGRRWMDGEKTEEEQTSQSICQGGYTGFKRRTVPPPQGPGGRCRGTYEQCPSGSDA